MIPTAPARGSSNRESPCFRRVIARRYPHFISLYPLVRGNAPTRVYAALGNGEGSLQPPILVLTSNTAGEAAPGNAVAIGDLDGDGIDDLLLGFDDDGEPGSAWTHTGRGDGTFEPAGIFALDINPTNAREQGGGEMLGRAGFAYLFDFDFDGLLDLVLPVATTLYDGAGEIHFHRGRGDGTFDPTGVALGQPAVVYRRLAGP